MVAAGLMRSLLGGVPTVLQQCGLNRPRRGKVAMPAQEPDDPYGAFAAPAPEPREPSDRRQARGTASPLRQSASVASLQLSAVGVGWMLVPTIGFGRHSDAFPWWTLAALAAVPLVVGNLLTTGRVARPPTMVSDNCGALVICVLAYAGLVVGFEPFMRIDTRPDRLAFTMLMLLPPLLAFGPWCRHRMWAAVVGTWAFLVSAVALCAANVVVSWAGTGHLGGWWST